VQAAIKSQSIFIYVGGKRDEELILPINSSLSVTLDQNEVTMDAEVGCIASEFKVKDVGKARQATFIVSHKCLHPLPSFPGLHPDFISMAMRENLGRVLYSKPILS